MSSKQEDLYERLCAEIRAGKFAAGVRFPSEFALARRFKVGRDVVHRVLSRLKDEGVILARQGAETFLRAKGGCRFGRIGLIIHGSDYCEMFSPVARKISHLAQAAGVSLLFGDVSGTNTRRRVVEVVRLAREFISTGVDGVIFQPVELLRRARDINRDIVGLFDKAGVPLVLLDSDIVPSPERSGYDLASVNHFDAGRRLAAHLREAGAKRVAYLTQANRAPCVLERHLGVKTGCEGLALAGKELLAEPDDAARIRRFLARERPDAIACYNDRQAVVLMKTLAALGVGVPDDILVAGFDDVNFARLATPLLTTAHQPCDELAALAFGMLQERIRDPGRSVRETFLNAPLVVRDSTLKRKTRKGKAGQTC